jgi:hypothetical protein
MRIEEIKTARLRTLAKRAGAPDGRTAAVLVNWTRDAQPYALQWKGFKASGSLPPLSWHLVSLGSAGGNCELTINTKQGGER